MPKSSVVLVLVAFLLTGLVVPTGASGTDQLWDEPEVVLEPHDGPNGQYATINDDGELEVDLSSPGVNAGAFTVIDDVFYVTNNHEEPVAIWFSHEAMDEVVLSIDGQPAQSSSDAVELTSGEQATVGISIDSSSRTPGELVLSEFTIHAENRSSSSDGGSGGSSGGGSSGGSDDTTVNDTDDSPGDSPTGDDEVVFADGPDSSVEIRSLDLDDIDELEGSADPNRPPEPSIDASLSPRTLNPNDSLPRTSGGDAVVTGVGDSLTITGERTTFSTSEAIQPNGHIVRLVEIDVPAERRDDPAYVRLAVDRARLAGTDPTDARIGRYTSDGWQLLDTSVVDADNQQVVLQARVPGFSTFAVFADPAVSYRWELSDGQTANGISFQEQFDEPGRHEVTLTVTDAQGRESSTDFEVLVNDQPSVSIEAPDSVAPGEPVSLKANVTNEIGNATVTWQFEDGTTAVGETVDRSFEAGEHTVTVEVEDEYGATARTTATLTVGESGTDDRVSIELFQLSLSVEERLVYAAILIFLLIAGFREWGARGRRRRVRTR